MLPGSIINVGIYYGSLIDGFKGTVLSACYLYLPCFLALCGILPQWRYYRDKPGIQRLSIGITCVTIGFSFSVVLLSLCVDCVGIGVYPPNRRIDDHLHICGMSVPESWMGSVPLHADSPGRTACQCQEMGTCVLPAVARSAVLRMEGGTFVRWL
jgi:uncharacterized membrane protein